MSDCYTPDEAYEAGIESLTNDSYRLQDDKHELQQRYEQLEQVAKEMFGFMNLIFDDIGIEPIFTSAVTHKVMSLPRFRKQLEELGVSLDD